MPDANDNAAPHFIPQKWLFSGHLETIAALREKDTLPYETQVINTPDDDPVLFNWLDGAPDKPLIVIFHGLEGCCQSHTVRTIAKYFNDRRWTVVAPHFRSCGLVNKHPRAYHAADHADVRWMINFSCANFEAASCFAVGVSLGGNALIQHLDKMPADAPYGIRAAATVSAPLNLPAAARHLSRGLVHYVYGRHFVKRLCKKIKQKMTRYPMLCDIKKLNRVRTIADFDELYTAPIHGFDNAEAYWNAGCAQAALLRTKTPLLCVNALNDPMIPPLTLPQQASPYVAFCRPKNGGHGAFIGAPDDWLPSILYNFFKPHLP